MGLTKALGEAYSPVSITQYLLAELNGQALNSEEEIPGFVAKLVNLVQKRDFLLQSEKRTSVCMCVCCSQLNQSFFLPVGYYR